MAGRSLLGGSVLCSSHVAGGDVPPSRDFVDPSLPDVGIDTLATTTAGTTWWRQNATNTGMVVCTGVSMSLSNKPGAATTQIVDFKIAGCGGFVFSARSVENYFTVNSTTSPFNTAGWGSVNITAVRMGLFPWSPGSDQLEIFVGKATVGTLTVTVLP